VLVQGLDMAAVFEDDLVLASDLPEVLQAVRRLPRFDIVKLDQWVPNVEVGGPDHPLTENRTIRRPIGRDAGAAGYVVSRAGAQKLLRLSTRHYMPVDRLMFNPKEKFFHELDIYKAVPPAIAQVRSVEGPREAPAFGSGLVRGGRGRHGGLKLLRVRLRRIATANTKLARAIRLRALEASHPGDRSVSAGKLYDPATSATR
jgi:glycosyl transferase family 25